MTDYFEVTDRDGAARIGDLRLSESVTTPAIADDVVEDAGSLWPKEREAPEGDESALTILPHRGLPSGTPGEVSEAFAVDYPDVDYPSAAVVSPETAENYGVDAYVLSGAQGLVGHGEAFVEGVIETRESIPADTALYLPGVATPANVATLVSAGVDLIDTDRAVIEGTKGQYLTTDGAYFLEDLTELPCACPACQQPAATVDREDCVTHNVNALRAAIATARSRIREGRLRDYLEGQSRHEQWLTATMRHFDQEYAYVEQRTPLVRNETLTAASEDTIHRVEIQRFADRVATRYRNRFEQPLVLVPCSATKPYSDSKSHGRFHDAINFRGHTVSITSPIGVVPQELELTYPAQHYDSVVTGRWSETEIEFVADVLAAYLAGTDYPGHVAHLPEDYRPITDRVADRLGIEFSYTVEDHPTDTDSLANLAGALKGYDRYGKRERQHNTIRAIADYQFGEGAGDELFGDLSVESRYPKLRANDSDGEQLAAMVPEYGVLSLTLAGARRWKASDVPTRTAEIDQFVPRGSVLAPGVVDADDDIRVGDEVIFEGPKAMSIGRAEMSGPEMVRSTRGIASEVRHTHEK